MMMTVIGSRCMHEGHSVHFFLDFFILFRYMILTNDKLYPACFIELAISALNGIR